MDESLSELRARVAGRHRAVTRKVSRLKGAVGVEISGSSVDPRRDPALLKRYNRRQLLAYERSLNGFTSRKTQFVPDAQRRPVPAKSWNEYKAAERVYNDSVARDFAKVAGVKLPGGGQTIGERMDAVTPTHRQAYNPAVNSPYKPPTRSPRNIASEKALKKLTREMKQRMKPSVQRQKSQTARDSVRKMLDVINEPGLQAALDGLTDKQFMTVWNYTNFATGLSLNYDIKQSMLSGREQPWYSEALSQQIRNSHALVDWAKSLTLDG